MYRIDVLSLLLQQQQQARLASEAHSTEVAAAAAAVGQQHLRVLSHLRLPGPPAKLQLLQRNCHNTTSSSSGSALQESLQESLHVLAVSEGLWLLQISQQSHQIKLRHIAAAPAVLASAFSLPQHAARNSSSSSTSSDDAGQQQDVQQQQQQHIACVLPSGQLQLLSLPHLQQHQQHRIQTWLPGIAVHELLPYPGPQQLLLAQCSGTNAPNLHIGPAHLQQQQQQRRRREVTWLQCLDAATGAQLAAYQSSGGQVLVSTGLWDAAAAAFSNSAWPQSAASSSPEQQQQQQGLQLPGLHSSSSSSSG
jgi:molybdopterin-biosynthesis enzyme MoeA-like protein